MLFVCRSENKNEAVDKKLYQGISPRIIRKTNRLFRTSDIQITNTNTVRYISKKMNLYVFIFWKYLTEG